MTAFEIQFLLFRFVGGRKVMVVTGSGALYDKITGYTK